MEDVFVLVVYYGVLRFVWSILRHIVSFFSRNTFNRDKCVRPDRRCCIICLGAFRRGYEVMLSENAVNGASAPEAA